MVQCRKGNNINNKFDIFPKECSNGYFGSNCSNKCSFYCRGNSSCNHITGVCNEGCKAGGFDDLCGRTGGGMYMGKIICIIGIKREVKKERRI